MDLNYLLYTTLSDIADVFDQIYPKITKVEEKFNNIYFKRFIYSFRRSE